MLLKRLCFIHFAAILIGFLLFIFYSVYIQNPYSIPFIKTKMFEKHNSQYIADNQLGYKPKPNFSGYSDLAAYTEIHYDHVGARVNTSADKTPDTVDMISIGCSQTWGQGVRNADTFTQKVSELNGMKVANFGVSSYGGVESYLRLKENLNLKPKYVVYAFWEDHFNRNLILCNQTFPVCAERPVLKHIGNGELKIRYPNFTNLTFKINQRWFEELADYYNDGTYNFVKASFWPAIKPFELIHNIVNKINGYHAKANESEKIPAAKYIIKQMKATTDEIGAKLIVLFMPYYSSEYISTIPEELSTFLAKENIALINLEHTFKGMNARGIPLSIPKDGHISKEAHYMIAKSITHKIAEIENQALVDNQSNANSFE